MKRVRSYRLESFAKTTDTPMSGSAVKSHGRPKMGRLSSAIRTLSHLLTFQGCPPVLEAIRHLHRHRRTRQVHLQIAPRKWCRSTRKDQNQNLKEGWQSRFEETVCEIFLSQEFNLNLEDTELPALADSSPESDLEHLVEVVSKSRKHSLFTHFPKDRDCHVCLRTQITRAPSRRRIGEAVSQADQFGDLITANHSPQRGGWITEQSLVRCRGTRSCHSMDSI